MQPSTIKQLSGDSVLDKYFSNLDRVAEESFDAHVSERLIEFHLPSKAKKIRYDAHYLD